MIFQLTCTSNDDTKMTDYVYNLRMKDIAVSSEKHTYPYLDGSFGIDYKIEIDSLEQLLTIYKTVANDCILTHATDGTGTVVPTIEIYDSWRE